MKSQLFEPFEVIKFNGNEMAIVDCQTLMKNLILIHWFVWTLSSDHGGVTWGSSPMRELSTLQESWVLSQVLERNTNSLACSCPSRHLELLVLRYEDP